jgi:hypothetical protein
MTLIMRRRKHNSAVPDPAMVEVPPVRPLARFGDIVLISNSQQCTDATEVPGVIRRCESDSAEN